MGNLIKILNIGEELEFDVRDKKKGEGKNPLFPISVILVERAGRSAVLKITADYAVQIKQFKQHTIG